MAIETTSTYKENVERMITGLSVPITRERLGLTVPREKPFLIETGKHPDMPTIYPLYSNNEAEIQKVLSKSDMQLVEAVGIPGMLIACPSFIEIKPHKHEGSSANYLSEMRIGNDLFMLSTLEPDAWTSGLHFHAGDIPQDLRLEAIHSGDANGKNKEIDKNDTDCSLEIPQIEEYTIVYGMAFLYQEEEGKGYVMPRYSSVEPGVLHRLRGSKPNGAIIALRMNNAALYPEELRHLHV